MISIFDMFSIGIGPSSSHTVGPMRAAYDFVHRQQYQLEHIERLKIILYGSLAYTGVGHGSPDAIVLGLMGERPDTIDPKRVPELIEGILKSHHLKLLQQKLIPFSFGNDLHFEKHVRHKFHSNTLKFQAYNQQQQLIAEDVYYSIGGGFIVHQSERDKPMQPDSDVPFPFRNAKELLELCDRQGCHIADIVMQNEKIWRSTQEIHEGLFDIMQVMEQCIESGCHTEGILNGRLGVKRRAPKLFKKLLARGGVPRINHHLAMNWLDVYAIAVNEENAAGGRVVTAPTNGAAGIIPSVLNYYKYFCPHSSIEGMRTLLLTAGAIGMLYKMNASISGAEMGCQGEVGVACSMAAAGLAAANGGSPAIVENAAEIGMEHNLGLTCDPIDGLVQIPCIERNAMGAVKAVNAARLAFDGDGEHYVSLDSVINTMREIGINMNSIYKETSEGGLAVNVVDAS